MSAVETKTDLSSIIDAAASGNLNQALAQAREYLQSDKADILIGRLGMIVAHADPEGHRTIALAAAAMLSRLTHWIPASVDGQESDSLRALPLVQQALKIAAPVLDAGRQALQQAQYPHPFFPSEILNTKKTTNDVMHEAIEQGNAQLAEQVLLGLYGTGADYRTMQVRAYEALATQFQNGGHPLIYAVRGFQLLDAVEWGDQAPNIIHWLAPHLPRKSGDGEPLWMKAVHAYVADPTHSLTPLRTRLSAPKDENALPLRELILSNADPTQICQGVYEALIKKNASPQAVAAIISLAAADILHRVGNNDHNLFISAAHGLLFAAATHLVFRQVQDVEVLNLLFTAAVFVNALQKEMPAQPQPAAKIPAAGGGLIAASQLETLTNQLQSHAMPAALAIAQRYLQIGHDPRALFGTIALQTAQSDFAADQGHSLQILQAAAETFLAWPKTLATTEKDILLQIALMASQGKP